MKKTTSGVLYAPQSTGAHIPERVNALNEQVNNLQSRYYRSLAPDCELQGSSGRWYFGAILKKFSLKICRFRKNRHLCSDFHFEQAERFANFAVGIFYVQWLTYKFRPPCGALMRPLPVQGGSQRESGTFLFIGFLIFGRSSLSRLFITYCFILMTSKMKKTTSGVLYAPQSTGAHIPERVNALNEQVNNLQSRYYRSLAPDCELQGSSDRWYFGAILSACTGFIFPPLFVVTALCVYKAKKCRKGGKE